jgi:hypothetical protein
MHGITSINQEPTEIPTITYRLLLLFALAYQFILFVVRAVIVFALAL